MSRSLPFATAMTLCWLFGFSTNLFSQQKGIEEFIERDSVAYISIQDPSAILDQVESSIFFQNRHYEQALELLVDKQFSLVSNATLVKFESVWHELRDSLRQVKSISLIVHSWDEGYQVTPEFSIVFFGSLDTNRRLEDAFLSSISLLTDFEDGQSLLLSSLLVDTLKKLVVKQTANFVLVSNAPDQAYALIDRMEKSDDPSFRSLAKNRSYQEVQSLLRQKADVRQIHGFIFPQHFGTYLTDLIQDELWGTHPESLAGAGFQLSFQDQAEAVETPDGTYQPIVHWNFVAFYTQPAAEYGKLIEAFAPLEKLPVLPFKVTSITAQGFDPEKRQEAIEEIVEKNEIEDDFMGVLSNGLQGMYEEFDTKTILGASKETIKVLHEEIHLNDLGEGLRIERINDLEAATRLVEQKVKEENYYAQAGEQMQEVECDYGRLFARSESAIRKRLERFGSERLASDDEAISDQILSQQYEYFVNDEWMIHADHLSMKRFLQSVYEESPEPQTFDLLLDACRRNARTDFVCKIVYQSKSLEKNRIEEEHLWKKHYYNDDQFGAYEQDMSTEDYSKWEEDMAKASDKVFELFSSEPNEYGLRFAVESKEDAAAAVKQLLFHAFQDTFGTSISLYSKHQRKLQIYGQAFSFMD